LVAQPEDELLTARDGFVAAGSDAHDAIVRRGGGSSLLGVVEVDVAVGGEARVKRERQQATLVLGVDLGRDVEAVSPRTRVNKEARKLGTAS
jgi:hypothetical protein